VAIMDIFFGYNPYVMITIYALLVDGVFHALRARKVTPKRVTNQSFDFGNHSIRKMTNIDLNDPRNRLYHPNNGN
jgi:hypothetical protein